MATKKITPRPTKAQRIAALREDLLDLAYTYVTLRNSKKTVEQSMGQTMESIKEHMEAIGETMVEGVIDGTPVKATLVTPVSTGYDSDFIVKAVGQETFDLYCTKRVFDPIAFEEAVANGHIKSTVMEKATTTYERNPYVKVS